MANPSATYRVQLHAGFNFRNLEEIIPYLHQLGITTIYASPITTAFTGSTHGYDVTDPLIINPEIGTRRDLEKIAGLLKKHKMNWLQDIVPNHMAYDSGNPWLYDVLERGRVSPYYTWFDLDTDPAAELIGNKIMAPFLGNTLTECLQKGEIVLRLTEKGFVIGYFDKEYPVAASLYPWIITVAPGYPGALASSLQGWDHAIQLPMTEWTAYKKDWLQKCRETPQWMAFIDQRISFINGRLALVDELLKSQHYILTHAHLAAAHINYRRFFTVNSLICLRMEKEEVFQAYHQLFHQLYKDHMIQGLRIDHIDGLAAPGKYITGLRRHFGKDCYIVAEKILAAGEELPAQWEIQGETGYEFLALSGQLLTDVEGALELQAFYRDTFSEDMPAYSDLVFDRKLHFLTTQMGGEWNNLTDLFLRQVPTEISSGPDRLQREEIREALGTFMAAFPVYRVYPETDALPTPQEGYCRQAFSRARSKAPQLSAAFDLLDKWMMVSPVFFARLMQFTGPLAAKGIEDTTFYIYNPMIALNEVGNSPAVMGMTPAVFHDRMIHRQNTRPRALNATTTHDTKRGEDSRLRLQYLTAIPDRWRSAVTQWMRLNSPFITEADGQRIPSLNDEYFIYQSLLGGFPADLFVSDSFRSRFHDFLTKALREAGRNTSYDRPNETYEKNCHAFVGSILQNESAFLEDFIPFADTVIHTAMTYSLSQLLLKCTAPGIPDIYQGSELWQLSFVDPDNRTPVAYAVRKYLLGKIRDEGAKGLQAVLDLVKDNERKGGAKLYVTQKVLGYRKEHPQVFDAGDYIPLDAPDTVLSYVRRHGKDWALIIIPLIRKDRDAADRLVLSLPDDAPRTWTDLFTGDAFRSKSGAGKAGGSGIDDGGGSGIDDAGRSRTDDADESKIDDTDRSGIDLEIAGPFSKFHVMMLTGTGD